MLKKTGRTQSLLVAAMIGMPAMLTAQSASGG